MSDGGPIRCRMAACSETLGDGKHWSFYLLNDGDTVIESVVLHAVGYEWGDWGNSKSVDVRISGLAPGAHALIWRDDDSAAELRVDLSLRVQTDGREVKLNFEFPKLYHLRNLKPVAGLGKPGYQVTADG